MKPQAPHTRQFEAELLFLRACRQVSLPLLLDEFHFDSSFTASV
jgi:hypothetical protein